MRMIRPGGVRGLVFDQLFSSATKHATRYSTYALRSGVRALMRVDDTNRPPVAFIGDGIHSELAIEAAEHRQADGAVTHSMLLNTVGDTYREAIRAASHRLMNQISRETSPLSGAWRLEVSTRSQISDEIREERDTLER